VVGEVSTVDPSGTAVYSPKIRDQALVRKFVAQNGRGYLALNIVNGGNGSTGNAAVDPDPGTLHLQVWFNDVTSDATPPDPRGVQIVNATESQITTNPMSLTKLPLLTTPLKPPRSEPQYPDNP
jgi:hypothetical protein